MVKPISSLTGYGVLTKDLPFKANSPRTARLVTLPTGARLHSTGLHIPADLELDKWAVIGEQLAQIGSGVQWALGDWWAYGHHKYGERKAVTAAKKIPYEFGTLMNFGCIARGFETSRRREALSFSHHAEVASLKPAEQTKMLDRAIDRNWSVADLRKALRDKAGNSRGDDRGPEATAADLEWWLEEDAQRSRSVETYFWDEDPRFDYLSVATIEKLIKEASTVGPVWTKVTKGLKRYLKQRSAKGESFRPRKIETGWKRVSPNVYNEDGDCVRQVTDAEMAEIEANGIDT
jgi:hypothetical protein